MRRYSHLILLKVVKYGMIGTLTAYGNATLAACCVASSGGIAWRCVSLQAMIEYSSRPEELRPNYLRDKVSSWYRRRSPCGSNHDCLWPWDVCIPSSCVATGVSGLEQRQAARHDWSRAHGAILAVAAVPPE
ncbi:hypothetical protein Tco_1406236 [Tanacetum coccineum]